MLIPVLQFVAGFVALFYGGDILVKGSASLAARFGMSPLVIGLTIVAFGTSAPEFAVSLSAASRNATDISIGNVVGSNIANIGLILGISALIKPMKVESKIIRYYLPPVLLITCLLSFFLVNRQISRPEGIIFCVLLLAYIALTFWDARSEKAGVVAEFDAATPAATTVPWLQVGSIVAGLVLLVFGGKILVDACVEIATMIGVSQAIIGLTIVAVGTSLPELTTSLIAALRGYGDMAIGNVIGSNLFNILAILGITAIYKPLNATGVGLVDTGVMVLLTALMAVFLVTGRHFARLEGGILLLVYTAYTLWLVI